jgi:hypothetical protein
MVDVWLQLTKEWSSAMHAGGCLSICHQQDKGSEEVCLSPFFYRVPETKKFVKKRDCSGLNMVFLL